MKIKTVKELVVELLDYPMDAAVTFNSDDNYGARIKVWELVANRPIKQIGTIEDE